MRKVPACVVVMIEGENDSRVGCCRWVWTGGVGGSGYVGVKMNRVDRIVDGGCKWMRVYVGVGRCR